ncbi:MAG: hypothetical protein ABL886_01985 [Rhodoglobus sp.]
MSSLRLHCSTAGFQCSFGSVAPCALAGPCLVSCVTPQSKAELDAAIIGECPDEAAAHAAVRWFSGPNVHDPNTARFEYPSVISRGYYKGATVPKKFAWAMPVYITDRSTFVGFGDKWWYEFYFVDDGMVGYGATDYSSGWCTSHSMEFETRVSLETFRQGRVSADRPREKVPMVDSDQSG